jgi:diguanylate cyclase (GGDEF)-like protein
VTRFGIPGRIRRRAAAPRLAARFVVLTVAVLTVAAAVVVVVVRQAYATQARDRATARARLTEELALGGRLKRADVSKPLPVGRQRQLRRLFTTTVLRDEITAASLYDRNGKTVLRVGPAYATRERSLVLDALAGTVIAHVSDTPTGRTLNTYVPIRVADGQGRGVVVLRQPYAPIAAAARHSSLVVALVLEGVLAVLLLALVPPLGRASRRIQAQMDALEWLATHDDMTGLANRAGFHRDLSMLLPESEAVSVLLVDLDGFQELNDTLGPAWGDELLVQAAARLSNVDGLLLAGRLGEDEFGVVLPYAGATVQETARAITRALSEPLTIGDERVAVSSRIGVAAYPAHGTDPETLIRRAGVALSIAKESRHGVATYDPEHDASDVSRLALTAQLRTALEQRELTVYYQPQADLATGAVRGVEALVRWRHPERGLLDAGAFIECAEKGGLIGEIGRFVIETAAGQWQSWHRIGIKVDLAVNLSAVDLLDPQLPAELEDLLARYEMPPDYLVLEITERNLVRAEQSAGQVLEQLHRLGARLAIDDYGTGYSSLAYVRNLHAHQVKLDRTFVAGLPDHRVDEAIVRSTIELAHTLGATVVAEGVETPEQWKHLARLGCDIAQGFLIGRAVDAEEVRPLLAGQQRFRVVAA